MEETICFACTTPYQVMGAISIVCSENYVADIVIFDTFHGYGEVAENLKKEKLFSHVYTINFYETIHGENKWICRGVCMYRFVFAERYIKKYIPKINYSKFFSSSQAIPKMVLKRVLDKWNEDMQTVIYDDGMGTYFPTGHALRGSSLFRNLEKVMRFEYAPNGRTIFMPRFPEIAVAPIELTEYVSSKMPPMKTDQKSIHMMKRVFLGGEEKLDEITEKWIVFDDYRPFNNEKEELLDSIYNLLSDKLENDVICKPHPRSTIRSTSKIPVYKKTHVPMELLYMGMSDLDDKILISYYSTATFTPKLMFAKEPTLIFLYRIFLDDHDAKGFDDIVDKIEESYGKNIYRPAAIEELKECIGAANA